MKEWRPRLRLSLSVYVATGTDYCIAPISTNNSVTVRLPTSVANYRTFIVKDKAGTSQINPIAITTVGGTVTIDGQTTITLIDPYEALNFVYNGSNYEIY